MKLEAEYAKGLAKLVSDKNFQGELEFGALQQVTKKKTKIVLNKNQTSLFLLQIFEVLKTETGNIGLAHQQLYEKQNVISERKNIFFFLFHRHDQIQALAASVDQQLKARKKRSKAVNRKKKGAHFFF